MPQLPYHLDTSRPFSGQWSPGQPPICRKMKKCQNKVIKVMY